MFKEKITTIGNLGIKLVDAKTGLVKEDLFYPNIVTTVGKNFIASRMVDAGSPAEMSHMEVGTSGTTETVSDTQLGAYIAGSRQPFSVAPAVSGNSVTYVCEFAAGEGTGGIQEAGIFNSATENAGTMLCHTTFDVVNKGADDILTITWEVTIN